MLYLVRHGRTQANAEGRLQGRLNPPLDELGRRQAAAIAELVHALAAPDGGIDEVISSPLDRAQETASYFDLPVRIDDRWMEINYGKYEGAILSEVPPKIWQSWYDDPEFATEGGESFGGLEERVRESLDEIGERARTSNIVVVSHVSPIKSAVAWSLGAGYGIMFRCHLSHASLCRIGWGKFGPLLHTFNQTAPITPDPDG